MSNTQVVSSVSTSPVTSADTLLAKLQAAENENKALAARLAIAEAKQAARITVKIAEFGSGAVSLYGVGRFPTSLYPNQWAEIFRQQSAVETFIATHENELRSASFAHEFASKSFKAKYGTEYKGGESLASDKKEYFRTSWKVGYESAMADGTMYSARMAKTVAK